MRQFITGKSLINFFAVVTSQTEVPQQPAIVLPQAERESLLVNTSHKVIPELVSAVTNEQVIRSTEKEEDTISQAVLTSQPEETVDLIHRASPKDDVFSIQDQPQVPKLTVDHVTADIVPTDVVQADRELLELLTTNETLPEELSSLDEIELLRSSIAHDEQQHTRQEELEIIHRSAPKDELYSTITVHQELVGQPEVSVPSVQEEVTIITGKLILSTFIINSSLTNFSL